MSKKEDWIQRLAEYKAKNGDTITIKELAALTWNGKRNVVKYDKIYRAYQEGILPGTQLGPESSGCSITIDVKDAEAYLKSFHFSVEDLTPPSKLLPFPEISRELSTKTA